jgi:hypothetical protein
MNPSIWREPLQRRGRRCALRGGRGRSGPTTAWPGAAQPGPADVAGGGPRSELAALEGGDARTPWRPCPAQWRWRECGPAVLWADLRRSGETCHAAVTRLGGALEVPTTAGWRWHSTPSAVRRTSRSRGRSADRSARPAAHRAPERGASAVPRYIGLAGRRFGGRKRPLASFPPDTRLQLPPGSRRRGSPQPAECPVRPSGRSAAVPLCASPSRCGRRSVRRLDGPIRQTREARRLVRGSWRGAGLVARCASAEATGERGRPRRFYGLAGTSGGLSGTGRPWPAHGLRPYPTTPESRHAARALTFSCPSGCDQLVSFLHGSSGRHFLIVDPSLREPGAGGPPSTSPRSRTTRRRERGRSGAGAA